MDAVVITMDEELNVGLQSLHGLKILVEGRLNRGVFLFLFFFSIFQKYMSFLFFSKNVTQPPVRPAEGCYRRMNRQ